MVIHGDLGSVMAHLLLSQRARLMDLTTFGIDEGAFVDIC